MNRRPRSEKYQHLYCEFSCIDSALNAFMNNDSMSSYLNPFKYNEEILILQDKIKEELLRILKYKLTKRQGQVIALLLKGNTQSEVALILNINQSSVAKCFKGNSNGLIVYGGVVKKVQRICKESKKIQSLLQKINELQEEIY